MNAIVPVFVVGIFWFTVLAIVRAALDFSLRKKILSKDMNSEEVKALLHKGTGVDPYPNLKWGMVLMGIGSAVIVGNYLNNDQITAGLMLLLGGLGFLVYFLMTKKFADEQLSGK